MSDDFSFSSSVTTRFWILKTCSFSLSSFFLFSHLGCWRKLTVLLNLFDVYNWVEIYQKAKRHNRLKFCYENRFIYYLFNSTIFSLGNIFLWVTQFNRGSLAELKKSIVDVCDLDRGDKERKKLLWDVLRTHGYGR